MLFLLRNIRRKLMQNNKITTYLLYSVGEIILVVIGILIAVNIDDWYQAKEAERNTRQSLKVLQEELILDSLKVDGELIKAKKEVTINKACLDRMNHLDATLDTLIEVVHYSFSINWVPHIEYNANTFDYIKSNGTIELLSDTLRTSLVTLFKQEEFWLNNTIRANDQYRERFDDFSKTYVFNRRRKEENYIQKTAWENVDPSHFVVRAFWLVDTRYVLWNAYRRELEDIKERMRRSLYLINEELKSM